MDCIDVAIMSGVVCGCQGILFFLFFVECCYVVAKAVVCGCRGVLDGLYDDLI